MKQRNWLRLFFVMCAIVAGVAFIGTALGPVVRAADPTGAGPNDPMMVTGNWQTVAPNTRLWFYFDYTGDKSRIYAYLDTNGLTNIDLSVFTPSQAQQWSSNPSTAPIGRGTPPGSNTSDAVHDLVWLGAFNAPGRYFVTVTNNNPAPVSVRLFARGDNVALGPTPTPTARPVFVNPYARQVPVGNLQGRVLFQDASGGVIYMVNGDGTNLTRLTYGIDPVLSPDGKRIAFSRWNQPAGLFVANADGTNERQLLNLESLLSPQWSPDGTRIAYTVQKGGTTEGGKVCFGPYGCFTFGPDPHWKIGVVDASTGAVSEPQCSNHCFSPTWSSDGHTLAYADGTFGILLTDTAPNGGPARNLFTLNPAVQSTSYSPDGSKIVFMVKQADHWEINTVNSDGGNVSAVTTQDPLSFTQVNSVAPTWSPDGKQILFLSDRSGKWEFFVTNVDGSGMTQVLKSVTDAITIRYNFSSEHVADWIK